MSMLPCDLEPLYSLLACVTTSENALSISNHLMDVFGSMDRIFSCHISEIKREIEGTEEFRNKIAFLLENAKSLTRRRMMDGLSAGDRYTEVAVVKYLFGLFRFEPTEKVYMLFFDSKMRYVGKELVSSGTVNTTHVTIRRALEISLRHSASYIVLAHNHPLGKPDPSADDISTTNNLITAFAETGLKLLEHYIIGGASFAKILGSSNGILHQQCEILQ